MKSKSKVLTVSVLSAVMVSCSTVNLAREKTSFPAFCENSRAKQQRIFVVAAYNVIPSGISISSVKNMVESSSSTSDFIKDHFIQALLVYAYSDNASPVQNGVLFNIFKKRFVHGWAPTLPHLAWVKENKFAICEGASCSGMKFPDSADDIVEFDSQGWSDGRCHDFFMEDGYVPGWGCHGNAAGLLSFMKESGFNDGWLIANSYLAVPESQKRILCTDAGLKPECFSVFDSKDQFYKFRDMISANQNMEAGFAYMKSFNGVLDGDTALSEAKSAFTKDLAISTPTLRRIFTRENIRVQLTVEQRGTKAIKSANENG